MPTGVPAPEAVAAGCHSSWRLYYQRHEMSAALQAAHMLVLDHPFCGQGIDREFCQARRNPSA
jgi:hypothetical protein